MGGERRIISAMGCFRCTGKSVREPEDVGASSSNSHRNGKKEDDQGTSGSPLSASHFLLAVIGEEILILLLFLLLLLLLLLLFISGILLLPGCLLSFGRLLDNKFVMIFFMVEVKSLSACGCFTDEENGMYSRGTCLFSTVWKMREVSILLADIEIRRLIKKRISKSEELIKDTSFDVVESGKGFC